MFKCDNCGKQTEAGEKTYQRTINRPKEYEQYRLVFDSKTRRRKKEYYTTTGYETDRLLHFCEDCHKKHTKGEGFDGEDTQGKGRPDQGTERRNPTIKRRSKVNNSGSKRVAQ